MYVVLMKNVKTFDRIFHPYLYVKIKIWIYFKVTIGTKQVTVFVRFPCGVNSKCNTWLIIVTDTVASSVPRFVSDIISVLCAVLCSGDNACMKYASAQCQVFEGLIMIISSTSTNHRFRDNHAPEVRRTTVYKSMTATENLEYLFKTIE